MGSRLRGSHQRPRERIVGPSKGTLQPAGIIGDWASRRPDLGKRNRRPGPRSRNPSSKAILDGRSHCVYPIAPPMRKTGCCDYQMTKLWDIYEVGSGFAVEDRFT